MGVHPPCDPRVERSRRVILSAALDLLGEVGFGGLTIEGVAARAGVGKSTIYRHWCGKVDLVEDAVRTLRTGIAPPAEGSMRERVAGLLRQVAEGMADSTWSACLPAIIEAASQDPEVQGIYQRVQRQRRQVLVELLHQGMETGELPAGTDTGLLAECLVAPIMVRRLLFHAPFDPAKVPDLVDLLLPRSD